MVVSSMLASVSSSTVPLHKQFSKCHEDVPYIANWIYEHPGLDLNLKGIWIADPSLSYNVVQQEIPTLRFVEVNIPLFYLHFSLTRHSFRPTGTYSRSIVVSWLNYRTSLMPAVIRLIWTISSLTRRKGNCHSQSGLEERSVLCHRAGYIVRFKGLSKCMLIYDKAVAMLLIEA